MTFRVRGELVLSGGVPAEGTQFGGEGDADRFTEATATVSGNRLLVDTNRWQCREEMIPDVAYMFASIYDKYPKIQITAFQGNYHPLPVRIDVSGRATEHDWSKVLGVNRRFSPFASPFLLRYYIGMVRDGTCGFTKVNTIFQTAGKKGILLNENFNEAWLHDGDIVNLGLSGLEYLKTEWDFGNNLDAWRKIFPPSKVVLG